MIISPPVGVNMYFLSVFAVCSRWGKHQVKWWISRRDRNTEVVKQPAALKSWKLEWNIIFLIWISASQVWKRVWHTVRRFVYQPRLLFTHANGNSLSGTFKMRREEQQEEESAASVHCSLASWLSSRGQTAICAWEKGGVQLKHVGTCPEHLSQKEDQKVPSFFPELSLSLYNSCLMMKLGSGIWNTPSQAQKETKKRKQHTHTKATRLRRSQLNPFRAGSWSLLTSLQWSL